MKRVARLRVLTLVWHRAERRAFAKKPPQEWDGLTLVKLKGMDAAYARPGADFSIYNKIIIDPIQVAFSKNWDKKRPFRSASSAPSSSRRSRRSFGKLAEETFAEVLQQEGRSADRDHAGTGRAAILRPPSSTCGRAPSIRRNRDATTSSRPARAAPRCMPSCAIRRPTSSSAAWSTGARRATPAPCAGPIPWKTPPRRAPWCPTGPASCASVTTRAEQCAPRRRRGIVAR